MKIINYKPEVLKPGVILDIAAKKFELYGKSCPENVAEFYQPILDWIDEYIKNPLDETIFEFRLNYYNTATSKILFLIMQKLERVFLSGKKVKANWYFPEEDEALQEAGEEFNDLIDFPVELIPLK